MSINQPITLSTSIWHELRFINITQVIHIWGIKLTEVLDKDTFHKLRSFKSREREKRQQQNGKAMANV